MRKPNFTSAFKTELASYLDAKTAAGFKEKSFRPRLVLFDRFCAQYSLDSPTFTKEMADEWRKRRAVESTTTHYRRVNTAKHFLAYIYREGYDVHVTRDVAFKATQFQPHIYTEAETERYFNAVDSHVSPRNRKNSIQRPVLFRLLYCCGTRIDETLRIRKKDVDLEEGIIKLYETKNNRERYIVLGDDLLSLMKKYAAKCFYLLGDTDYIFRTANGGRLSGDIIYDYHRSFLKEAGIPYHGGGAGPRVHDWRHTHAVNAFKQMVDAGMDMYVALPVLSTSLGHKSVLSTEQYVRLTFARFPYIEEKFKCKLDAVFGKARNETD
jgi:integrase